MFTTSPPIDTQSTFSGSVRTSGLLNLFKASINITKQIATRKIALISAPTISDLTQPNVLITIPLEFIALLSTSYKYLKKCKIIQLYLQQSQLLKK